MILNLISDTWDLIFKDTWDLIFKDLSGSSWLRALVIVIILFAIIKLIAQLIWHKYKNWILLSMLIIPIRWFVSTHHMEVWSSLPNFVQELVDGYIKFLILFLFALNIAPSKRNDSQDES